MLTVLISGFILAGVFIPPLVINHQPRLAEFFYYLYSPLCHQRPDRCYLILGQALAVCSRCLGIYSGFFLISFFYPLFSQKFKHWVHSRPYLIVITALPMVLDVSAGLLKLWSSSLILKSATGFIWSSCLPFYWFPALEELNLPWRKQ
ncbi:MAG: DUF2085 domain-containing protein [Candidatus Saccharicenans sp.]